MIKFGVDALLTSTDSSLEDTDLDSMLGPSHRGHWAADAPAPAKETLDKAETAEDDSDSHIESADDSIYVFMGKDYSAERKQADDETVDKFVAEATDDLLDESRFTPRRQGGSLAAADVEHTPARKRKREYTAEERQV